jgi:cobyrinic acid a,c-diamide synthase
MYAPTVHLGGSGFTILYEQYTEAIQSLGFALDALNQTCPHPRDFIKLDGGYQEAMSGHLLRVGHLRTALHQLEALRDDVCKQQDERERMKRR